MAQQSGAGASEARLHMRCYAGPAVVERNENGKVTLTGFWKRNGAFMFQDVCVVSCVITHQSGT